MSNEIYIYGDIGDSWWSTGVTEDTVKEQLLALPQSDNLNVRINTVGGLTGVGLAIFNLLRSYSSKQKFFNPNFKLTTTVDGFAFSAGSVIMLAGEERVMALGSRAMIHNPWGGVEGDYREMQKAADYFKESQLALAQLYSDITGKDKAEFVSLMDDETYFSPQEAVVSGLATKAEEAPSTTKIKVVYSEEARALFTSLAKKGSYHSALMKAPKHKEPPLILASSLKSEDQVIPSEKKIISEKQPVNRLYFESLLATLE